MECNPFVKYARTAKLGIQNSTTSEIEFVSSALGEELTQKGGISRSV